MAYAFNEDKTKVEVYSKSEVYSKDDFKLVDIYEYIRPGESKYGTFHSDDIVGVDEQVVISLQLYNESMEKWFIHDSNWIRDIQLYNNNHNKCEIYYEIHNPTQNGTWVHLYIVLLKFD